jgi:hypothetical protein
MTRSQASSILGALGGRSKSPRKVAAARKSIAKAQAARRANCRARREAREADAARVAALSPEARP